MYSFGRISSEDPSKYYRSLTWYLACRVAVIAFLLGGAVIFSLSTDSESAATFSLVILIGLSFSQALFSALILRKIKNLNIFSQIQIVWDLVFVTVLILLTDGIGSVFTFAYLLVIVSASFLLPRKQTIFAAACAAILFGGLLDLQYFHYLHPLGIYRVATAGHFLSSLFAHVVAFFLTAYLSGTLSDRWRSSEAELQKRQIDLHELEKYNQMILEHISSGLMLIDSARKIRSFNRAAAEITGYSLEDVYNRNVEDLFRGFVLFRDNKYNLTNRAEGAFENKNEKMMVLGYATTAIKDRHGYDAGLLVTFQDLTQLKIIEEQLQRADRLAAIGKLASGMAHEIRNPLASISGSVQLLMEGSVSNEDRRLMKIVIREADRLSRLLTNFLTYARPAPPQIAYINISEKLDDLLKLLRSDQRFKDIELLTDYPENLHLWLDDSQLHQALWDIAVNASEAMQGRGCLRLVVKPNGIVQIEDSGPGIPTHIKDRIFDPFFSTKDKGTGLGLATVHSLIESQGGSVHVGSSALGGAVFSLNFSLLQGDA